MARRWVLGAVAVIVTGLLVLTLVGTTQGGLVLVSGTMMRVTQVRPNREKGAKMDPTLNRDAKNVLINKLGSKFNAYKVEAQDTRDAKIGKSEQFTLVNGESITLTVLSHTTSTETLELKVQKGSDLTVVTLPWVSNLFFVYDQGKDKDDPLYVVVNIALLVVHK